MVNGGWSSERLSSDQPGTSLTKIDAGLVSVPRPVHSLPSSVNEVNSAKITFKLCMHSLLYNYNAIDI